MPKYKLKPLKGKKNFADALASGKRFYEGSAAAVICFGFEPTVKTAERLSNKAGLAEIFFAVSIRKKTAKKAVVRNRVKRLLREGIRQAVAAYTDQGEDIPFNCIIIFWKSAPENPKLIRLSDVQPAVESIFKKAAAYGRKILKSRQEADNHEKNSDPAY